MSKKFSECSRCEKPINYGTAYVTILRNIEQADFDLKNNTEEITVIDSREVITLCAICGNLFNSDLIETIINGLPSGENTIQEN